MLDSMPCVEGQGATTAAPLFGVLSKEAVSDDVLCRIYWFVIACCLLLLFGITLIVNNKNQYSIQKNCSY
jgi:hypothetical protein